MHSAGGGVSWRVRGLDDGGGGLRLTVPIEDVEGVDNHDGPTGIVVMSELTIDI